MSKVEVLPSSSAGTGVHTLVITHDVEKIRYYGDGDLYYIRCNVCNNFDKHYWKVKLTNGKKIYLCRGCSPFRNR